MTTALLIHDNKLGEVKAQFITTPSIDGKTCQGVLHQCNDEWVPINILATNIVAGAEIEHHLDVRREAIKKGTLSRIIRPMSKN